MLRRSHRFLGITTILGSKCEENNGEQLSCAHSLCRNGFDTLIKGYFGMQKSMFSSWEMALYYIYVVSVACFWCQSFGDVPPYVC